MTRTPTRPLHLLAYGFGTGLSPVAPGTVGTLVGVAVYLPASGLSPLAYGALVAALFAVGIPICGRTARDLGVHDHGSIVWDEIVGYLVTMFAAPSGPAWIVAGFVLFRFFDIFKPWPIRQVDRRLGGGLGIMLDDVLAGIYGAAALQIAARFLA